MKKSDKREPLNHPGYELDWWMSPVALQNWLEGMEKQGWEIEVGEIDGELYLRIRRATWKSPHIYFNEKRYYVGEDL